MDEILQWLAATGPFASGIVYLLLRQEMNHLHDCVHRIETRLDKHTHTIYNKLEGKEDKKGVQPTQGAAT